MQGHYIYIDTGPPTTYEYSARLDSEPMVPTSTTACLSFWYYMYGGRGNLGVFVSQGITGTHDIYNGVEVYYIWNRSYEATSGWQNAQVCCYSK